MAQTNWEIQSNNFWSFGYHHPSKNMWCIAQFGTICVIFKLYKWYKVMQSIHIEIKQGGKERLRAGQDREQASTCNIIHY